jgi:hypothetical protein
MVNVEGGRKYDDDVWNKHYDDLAKFKQKYGNCLVPQKYQADLPLGCWVDRQRCLLNRNKLLFDRKGLLDEIGFVWRAPRTNKKWPQKLVEFKKRNHNGNKKCLVPQRRKEDVSLGACVGSNQRRKYVNNPNKLGADAKLGLAQKKRLEEIGLVLWNKHYDVLAKFKRKHGHCLVPQRYEEDTFLGAWVSRQRELHCKSKLRVDRKALLDEIGFAWRARKSNKKWPNEKQVELKRNTGNKCLVPRRNKDDASLGANQRREHAYKLGLDQKELLEKRGLTVSARSSTTSSSVGTEPAGQKRHAQQKRLLGLESNPEYRKKHESPASLLALWEILSTHRTSVVFRHPVTPKEAPGYLDRILVPMDLSRIRKKIVTRKIKSYGAFHKRIAQICNNCVKFNGR